jgi:hypothetical protein
MSRCLAIMVTNEKAVLCRYNRKARPNVPQRAGLGRGDNDNTNDREEEYKGEGKAGR